MTYSWGWRFVPHTTVSLEDYPTAFLAHLDAAVVVAALRPGVGDLGFE